MESREYHASKRWWEKSRGPATIHVDEQGITGPVYNRETEEASWGERTMLAWPDVATVRHVPWGYVGPLFISGDYGFVVEPLNSKKDPVFLYETLDGLKELLNLIKVKIGVTRNMETFLQIKKVYQLNTRDKLRVAGVWLWVIGLAAMVAWSLGPPEEVWRYLWFRLLFGLLAAGLILPTWEQFSSRLVIDSNGLRWQQGARVRVQIVWNELREVELHPRIFLKTKDGKRLTLPIGDFPAHYMGEVIEIIRFQKTRLRL